MVAWWSIRNPKERERAKREDEKRLAERKRLRALARDAGVKETTLDDGRTGFASRSGGFWEHDGTKARRKVALLLAQSGLYPNPLLVLEVEKDRAGVTASLRGVRSGTLYHLPLDSPSVIRATYKSAAQCEGNRRGTRERRLCHNQ
jgi:hypothetical protein